MANFDIAIAQVLIEEGGKKYTNNKKDKGGETKYGISKTAYPHLDIKNLTEDQAKSIYKLNYWDKIKGDLILSQKVANCIFDCATNMGFTKAIKFAQEAARCKIDGLIGPQTLAYINSRDPDKLMAEYTKLRKAKYNLIVQLDPTQECFLNGWLMRAERAIL